MKKMIFMMAAFCCLSIHAQKKWTLDECINYAMENNLTLKLSKLKQRSAQEDVMQSKAALFPTLSANTNQGVGYSPFDNTAADKAYYNGSYGVNAQWTVWNGGQNTNTVKQNKLTEEQAELSTNVTANSLQEQITKLYVQILYMSEAIEVNRQSLETSKKNEERGQQMVEVGKMSKADLAQLTAQRASSEYSIVESETQLAKYKLQLKQALDLDAGTAFDVAIPATSDQQALAEIPSLSSVFEAAMAQRPEIKNALLGIESSNLQMKIAKAGALPTVTVNGGVGTSTNSMSSLAWGTQMKNNFDLTASVGVSVPIFDSRRTKTNVNKARIAQEQAHVNYDNE
jgi:outer membrane protein